MKALGFILALLLVTVGSYFWLAGHVGSVPAAQSAAVVEAASSEFAADGVLLQYYASGSPTFYLLYETEGHRFIRKELRFVEERGCNPNAGDLPCVYPSDPNLPPVPLGSHVRVDGRLVAQRVMVEQIALSGSSESFEVVETAVGETHTSGEISIGVQSIRFSEGCQVFVGCFDYDVPKAVSRVDAGGQHRVATMVPGMLTTIPGGALALVWASPGEDTALFVIAHGK